MNDWLEMDLFVTLTAVSVAGLAAVLGIWMERDKNKPPRYAWALSILILLTTLVSLAQSWLDEAEQDKLQDDMARMLQTMDKLASETNDPRLAEMVASELAAQSRTNPDVVEKVAQRVADEGEDPTEMLARNLGEAELEKVARENKIKPKSRKSKPKEEAEPAAPAAPANTMTVKKGGVVAPAATPTAAPAAEDGPKPTMMMGAAKPVQPAAAPVEGEAAAEPAAQPTAAPIAKPKGMTLGGAKGTAKPTGKTSKKTKGMTLGGTKSK